MQRKRVVTKYPLPPRGEAVRHEVTGGAKILCMSQETDYIYLEESPNAERTATLDMMLIGTGKPFDPNSHQHVGIVTENGFSWHLYAKLM